MASRRYLKKEIDYLIGQVIGDAHLSLFFHPEQKREDIVAVMEQAVALRNDLFARMKPEEKITTAWFVNTMRRSGTT
ncbi:MAG: hypothetical protein LUD68_02245 [Rikenellaceae bacterium]|nr:hypothetical protein [Rikenellaceae bacterium]